MNTLFSFFDAINNYLGVNTPTDLLLHPAFIILCIILFLYALFTGMKYMAIIIAGFLGTGVIIHYLYPSNTSDLGSLLTFLGALGAMALVLIYFGFIRE